jgi:hypothetical protein
MAAQYDAFSLAVVSQVRPGVSSTASSSIKRSTARRADTGRRWRLSSSSIAR